MNVTVRITEWLLAGFDWLMDALTLECWSRWEGDVRFTYHIKTDSRARR